jgi:hypothetical protein
MVKILLEKEGIDVNVVNREGTAISRAIPRGGEVAKLLLEHERGIRTSKALHATMGNPKLLLHKQLGRTELFIGVKYITGENDLRSCWKQRGE